tara:strand:+ start:932 stop:1186 length:255 start_codon:yes stop_codon:yes gene_type:complete
MVTLIDKKTSNAIQANSNSYGQPTTYNKTDANNYDELFEMMLFYYEVDLFSPAPYPDYKLIKKAITKFLSSISNIWKSKTINTQ